MKMKINIKNINKEFVLLSIIFIAGFVLGLGSLFLSKNLETNSIDSAGYILKVDLPIEGALVSGNQTFRAGVEGLDLNDYQIDWSVDGIRKGTMGSGEVFMTDMVFVDDWDWRRDGKYIIEFSAKKDGQEIAKTTKTVYKNEFLDKQDDILTKTKEVEKKTSGLVIKNKTAQVSNSFLNLNKEDNFYSTNIKKVLSLEWITTDKKDWVTQEFVLNTENFLDYRAFWQVENGHSNPINKKNDKGQNILAINFSGWWWKGSGPYLITVYLEDFSGKRIASLDFSFTRAGSNDVLINGLEKSSSINLTENIIIQDQLQEKIQIDVPKKEVDDSVENIFINDKKVEISVSKNKWRLKGLLPSSKPAIYSDLVNLKNGPAYDREAISFIYDQPNSIWLNGNNYDFKLIKDAMNLAKEKNSIPVFVLYNIPQRDCSLYSKGGAANYSLYKEWIDKIVLEINFDAIFIVEPDALSMLNCLDQQGKNSRIDAIKYTVNKLTALSNSYVYIDAGHPFWVNSKDMAQRLKSVDVDLARGFALNVSNYVKLEDNISYGNYLSGLLGGKYYVVDSSRNGQGQHPKYEWCNPEGRGLGNIPTIYENEGWLDAELWIKTPGESDGTCQGGPNAGSWWRDYAVKLYTFRKK